MSLPREQVVGPSYVPLAYGLFSAVPPREDDSFRWMGKGLVFETVGISQAAQTVVQECSEDTPGGNPVTSIDFEVLGQEGLYESEGDTFIVQTAFQCSPVGMTAQQAQEAANLRLVRLEERAVETAFATGDLNTAPSLSTTTTVGTAGSIREALAVLDQKMAQAYNETGVIHMSRSNAMLGLAASVLESRGGRLHTPLGTPVAAGVGYSFDDLRGTPPMLAYRSEILSFEDLSLFDREQNIRRALAQRAYALGMAEGDILSVTIDSQEG